MEWLFLKILGFVGQLVANKSIEKLIDKNLSKKLQKIVTKWAKCLQLNWGLSREEMEKKHVLFMNEDKDGYIDKLFDAL